MMWSHMSGWDAWGPGWAWFALSHILWWALILVGIVALLRWMSGRGGSHPPHRAEPDRAIALLRERYARGEIDKAEFESRKHDLGG